MNDTAEQIVLEVDETPVIKGVARANASLDAYGKGAALNIGKAGKSFEDSGNLIVRTSDRTRTSVERLVASSEKLATTYGKSGVDKLIAQRDQLIQRLGNEEKAVERVRAAYAKMIAAESPHGGGKFQEFGEGVKRFVEDPMKSAGGAVAGLGGMFGTMGAAALGVGTAIAAVGAVMFEFAKGAGEDAEALVNLSDRTGISIGRLDQLSAMAKIAHVDISALGRASGNLAVAMEGSGEKADKARAHLQNMGITMHDLHGDTRELESVTNDVLVALSMIPNDAKRIAVAFETLGRKPAQELMPLIKNLGSLQEAVKSLGFGLDEDGRKKSAEFDDQLDKLALRWTLVKRELAKPVNAVFEVVFGPVTNKVPALLAAGEITSDEMTGAEAVAAMRADDTARRLATLRPAASAYTKSRPKDQDYWQSQERDARDNIHKLDSSLRDPIESSDRVKKEAEIKQARADLATAKESLRSLELQKGLQESLPKTMLEREKQLAEAKALTGIDDTPTGKAMAEFRKGRVDDAALAKEDLKYHSTKLNAMDAEIAAQHRLNDGIKVALAAKKELEESRNIWGAFEGHAKTEQEKRNAHMFGLVFGPAPSQVKDWSEGFSADEQIRHIQMESGREAITSGGNQAIRMAQLQTGGTRRSAAEREYQIRMSMADQLHTLEMGYAAEEDTVAHRRVAEAKADAEFRKATLTEQRELTLQIAEIERHQFEEIKGKTEGLLHTLFTDPRNFGKQFMGTVRDAILKPIEERIASPIAHGIQGLFGGKRGISDVQLTPQGYVPVVVMGDDSGNSGGGPSSAPGNFRNYRAFARTMGLSLPLAAAMAMGAPSSSGGVATSQTIDWLNGDRQNVGGTTYAGSPAGDGGYSGGGPGGSSVGQVLGSIFGGGGGSNGGNPLSGILGNLKGGLKGINWGGLTRADAGGLPGVDGQPGKDLGNTGKITGVDGIAGAALSAGGMMLAQRGLLGKDRGTWAGVGEGALGGAMIGFQMGGPLGAAIGGMVGFGIGIGEKIAGVETPEREAARLIKSIYGLKIDSGSTTIQQIVGMAKQNYGGSVSMAVRSAPVRELLQLYADNTGQKSSSLLAQQVHSASLTQSGGSLYQSATYQNGTPYTYATNLPTLGPSGGTLPTSNSMSGPVIVQVSHEATQNLWATGTAMAIAGNPRGVAAANVSGSGQSAARLNNASLQFSPSTITS